MKGSPIKLFFLSSILALLLLLHVPAPTDAETQNAELVRLKAENEMVWKMFFEQCASNRVLTEMVFGDSE